MNTKNIFAISIFLVVGLIFYSFVWPFKTANVDNVSAELDKMQSAYENATKQLSLKTLRLKKQQLGEQEISLLQNFIPSNLHSGYFVYNLGQLANQSRLTLKGLQYTVVSNDSANASNGDKKLVVEFSVDGRYEDFSSWIQKLEQANVLIDVVSIRGVKNSNNSEIISFNVKLYAYGIKID